MVVIAAHKYICIWAVIWIWNGYDFNQHMILCSHLTAVAMLNMSMHSLTQWDCFICCFHNFISKQIMSRGFPFYTHSQYVMLDPTSLCEHPHPFLLKVKFTYVASSSPCIIHEGSWHLLSHWPISTHRTRLWPSHGTHEMERQRQWRDRATKSLSGLQRCISEDIKGPEGLDHSVIKAQCMQSSGGFTCVMLASDRAVSHSVTVTVFRWSVWTVYWVTSV